MRDTREEILENWETEYQYRYWYAVDCYDPTMRRVHRLYVGDADSAFKMASDLVVANVVDYDGSMSAPGELGPAAFYRATLVDAKAARDYLLCIGMHDAPEHSNELITVAQAAEELGITRQSAYELVRRGVIPSEECDGIRVGRYSVALRLAAKSGSRV